MRVVDKAIPWQRNGRPRRAGVSSFGFSGTNAHIVIEEAPPEPGAAQHNSNATSDAAAVVLPLSGRSPQALVALAQRYGAWLDAHQDSDIADVCFTAGAGRSHFEHRAALVVDSVQGARELLAGLAENRLGPRALRGVCGDPPKTAWLFTGQGSQYPGMARELFDAEPVFTDTVARCAEVLDDMLPHPLLEVLFDTNRDDGETLRHTSFAQPALFAIEMGLARLWRSWGIEPDVVLGHSVGQYVAACAAGVFSLEDGARLLAERGRLFGSLPEGGRMVAVFADAEHVEDVTDEFPQVSVAAYNGTNTVLSGPAADLEQIVGHVRRRRHPLFLAGHESRLPLRTDRAGARRIPVIRSSVPVRRPDSAAGLQPHRRGDHRGDPAELAILAPACPAAGAVRRERAHRGPAGMFGVDGDRPAADSDRRRTAGLAGILDRAPSDRLGAQGD